MKNVIELRKQLCQIFVELRRKRIQPKLANELTKTAGKIISSVKTELDYASLRKETPIVEFLGGDKTPAQRAK